MSYLDADIDRRIGAMIQVGVVAALDEAQARVQVDLDGPITTWIPWATVRAGGDRTWWAPEVGEQVIVLAPSGELSGAFVVGSLYQNAFPEPAASKDIHRTEYADGSSVEFNRATSTLTVDVGSGNVIINCASATINAADSVTLDTPKTTCTGELTVEGLLTYSAGMKGSGGSDGAAIISGSIVQTGGVVSSNGIVLDSHDHTTSVGPPV